MLTLLTDFPDDVIAVVAHGEITKKDYTDTLIPAVEKALTKHDKISCYYELDKDFDGIKPGAMMEDTLVGMENFFKWNKIAFVCDVSWMSTMVNMMRFIMPAHIRVFSSAEKADARKWLATE